MLVDMANSYFYIFTHIFVNVHLLCTYYILTVYLLYKVTAIFSPMFFLLFLKHVIYHQHTYN